jgi:hypothetical protein
MDSKHPLSLRKPLIYKGKRLPGDIPREPARDQLKRRLSIERINGRAARGH